MDGRVMTTITVYACLLWLVWGICMGFGWAFGSWLFSKIMAALNG